MYQETQSEVTLSTRNMAMNPVDQDLASAYKRHGGPLKAWKHFGKKTAGSVKDAVKKGGKAVGSYFADKLKGKSK